VRYQQTRNTFFGMCCGFCFWCSIEKVLPLQKNKSKLMRLSNKTYHKLTSEQLDKVGNAMIFLSTEIPGLQRTKLLKLLYILDEFSIERSGIPFFNLQYKMWRFGPVSPSIFLELKDKLIHFDKYIQIESEYINPKLTFCDDEFSDNDIDLLYLVVEKFKNASGRELVDYTHRPHSPWRNAAERNNIYRELESGEITYTDITLNLGDLVKHDKRKKSIYQHYIEEN
jgi:uncharacterized phage-associated protein